MNEADDTTTMPEAPVDALGTQAHAPLYDLFGGIYALQAMAEDRHGDRMILAEGVAWLAERLLADAKRVLHVLDEVQP